MGSLAIPPEGFAWGLLSAVALAFYTLLPVRVLGKWGSLLVTGLAMLFGGAAATVAVQPWAMPVQLSGGALVAIVAIVLVGTLGAYMLYLQGVADAGPVKASLLCSVEPVAALVISALWLQAPVSAWDVAGCVAIVAMVVLVTEREEAPADAAAGVRVRGARSAAVRGTCVGAGLLRGQAGHPRGLRPSVAPSGRGTAGHSRARHRRRPEEVPFVATPHAKHQGRHLPMWSKSARGNPLAVFAVSFSPDKNYARGIEGAWLTETDACPQPYAELHWVAVDEDARHRGVGMFVLDRAERIARAGERASLRADVYERNVPMQRLLEKHGYERCGTIEVRDVFGRQKTAGRLRATAPLGAGNSSEKGIRKTWIFARPANRTSTSSWASSPTGALRCRRSASTSGREATRTVPSWRPT